LVWVKRTYWQSVLGQSDNLAKDMHQMLIIIICAHSKTVDNGPLLAGFPVGAIKQEERGVPGVLRVEGGQPVAALPEVGQVPHHNGAID
jgi:hypothetical protein